MPTNNKTSKIGLNAWVDTDKPKRSDFVADNQQIDTVLGGHIEDTVVHLTADQRAKISAPFVAGVYAGDGTAESFILLSFTPSLIFVAQQDGASARCSGGESVVGSGMATAMTTSGGVRLGTNRVYVTQTQGTPANGIRYNLNASGTQYMYVAFK